MPSTNGGSGTRPRAYPGHDGTGADADGIGPEDVAVIQRARIIAAMVDEVSERGSANVTVAHVVGRSGVSRRTFYELFADIRDCFLAAFDETLVRASRYVLDAYDPAADWRERVRAALVALLEFVEREPDAGRLLIVDSLGVGAPTLARRQQVVDRIVAVVDEGRMLRKPGSEPLGLAAEGAVGGVLSVLHTRLLEEPDGGGSRQSPLIELTGSLMSMIVLPYLGQAGARRELRRPVPKQSNYSQRTTGDPLRDVDMRLTYRTIRVLLAVGTYPGCSNREIAQASGAHDQGQISKLLSRLEGIGLIANSSAGQSRGATNAGTLTAKGLEVESALSNQTPA
jgi:AcrR family transcriptional regulator/DNA-binding MarR family transcriptional regulator